MSETSETKDDAVESGRVVSRLPNQPNLVSGVRFGRVSADDEAPVYVSEVISDPDRLRKFLRSGYQPWDGEGGSDEEIAARIEECREEQQTQRDSDRETIEGLIENNKAQGRELSRLRQENEELREQLAGSSGAQAEVSLREAETEVTDLKGKIANARQRVEAIASQANAKAIKEALETLAADLAAIEDDDVFDEEGERKGEGEDQGAAE